MSENLRKTRKFVAALPRRVHPWFRFSIFISAVLGLGMFSSSSRQVTSSLSFALLDNQTIRIAWPSDNAQAVLEQTDSLQGTITWQPATPAPVLQGLSYVVNVPATGQARFYRLRQLAAQRSFSIASIVPADGSTEVGVTFRPKITFSEPVNPTTLSSANFHAEAAGQLLGANIVPANDGSFAWLFFEEPMPGGTRVRTTVDGSSILSAKDGTALDADGDGTSGGVGKFEFTTVSRVALPGTSLSGMVVDPGPDLVPRTSDDADPGPDGAFETFDDMFFLPIAGVKVYLLGREDQAIFTGPNGFFHFNSVPAGDVKIVVDGQTATSPPQGMYFPEMVLDAQMRAGLTNFAMKGMPEIYLPRLSRGILQTVDVSRTNVITTNPDAAQGLTDEQRQNLTIEVPPNVFVGPGGTRLNLGQVGISTVPPELVRDMLPPGVLQHTFDITVQAPGIATFSTPAPMTFPNIFNAAPGMQLNFLSFDHTTGRLVIEGTATVSADGESVRTDPGTGITHPGWHGLTPPGTQGKSTNPPSCSINLPNPFL